MLVTLYAVVFTYDNLTLHLHLLWVSEKDLTQTNHFLTNGAQSKTLTLGIDVQLS